jgi:excisionase family DNA binding protein
MVMEEPDSAAGWHLLSIREIAAACQLSEKAVRRAIDEGELPAVKLRSRLRITPDDFASWIASSRRATPRANTIARARKRRPHPAGTFRALLQADADCQDQL